MGHCNRQRESYEALHTLLDAGRCDPCPMITAGNGSLGE